MKRIRHSLFLALCVLLTHSLSAQEYSILGDIELRFDYLHEPTRGLPASARLSTRHDIYAATATATAIVDLTTPAGVLTPERATISVPQIYLTLYPAEWLTVTTGKQRTDWGVALPAAPGDQINPPAAAEQQLADSGDAQSGFWGLSASLTPSGALSVLGIVDATAAVDSETPPTDLRYGGRLGLLLAGIDTYLGAQYRSGEPLLASAGASVDLAGAIVAGDAALAIDSESVTPQLLLSADRSFVAEIGTISAAVVYRLSPAAAHLVGGSLGGSLTDRLATNHFLLANLTDGSVVIGGRAAAIHWAAVDVFAEYALTTGSVGELNPERTVLVSLGTQLHF